jgi:hypothetical protein
MENQISKSLVIDYLWLYSRFYGIRLSECENLYLQKSGYAAVTLLFGCLENISKSVISDFDSSFNEINKQLKKLSYITEEEYKFLNGNEFSIRKIRNLFAHANIAAIHLINYENKRQILYPLTEEKSCLLLYDKISLIIFYIILKLISSTFVTSRHEALEIDINKKIKECHLEFKICSSSEMLELKGFPRDYLSDDMGISEDAKIRLIENESDINIQKQIYKGMLQ